MIRIRFMWINYYLIKEILCSISDHRDFNSVVIGYDSDNLDKDSLEEKAEILNFHFQTLINSNCIQLPDSNKMYLINTGTIGDDLILKISAWTLTMKGCELLSCLTYEGWDEYIKTMRKHGELNLDTVIEVFREIKKDNALASFIKD